MGSMLQPIAMPCSTGSSIRAIGDNRWRSNCAQPSAGTGSCQRFAAYVRLPPEDGKVELVFCPQFVNEGTPALRRLTILHEMVHVVAGPDECRAMAFAAHIENLATGGFTPVDPYWRANNCADSGFNLP
jgi:hypothetical protein